MSKKTKVAILIASVTIVVVVLLICGVLYIAEQLTPKPVPVPVKTELTIRNDQDYFMFGFYACKTTDANGKQIDAYLFTLVLPDDYRKNMSGKTLADLSRATIIVPKDGLIIDRSLPKRTIRWIGLKTVEGKKYAVAHWNPSVILPVTYVPVIRQEKPLIRIKR